MPPRGGATRLASRLARPTQLCWATHPISKCNKGAQISNYHSEDRKWKLEWSPRTSLRADSPAGFERHFVETPNGKLELLKTAFTETIDTPKPPLFFQHGGFGCAELFIPWMEYFAKRGYPCYALSIRGHGNSWSPGYLETVFNTSASALAHDVAAGVKYVTALHQGEHTQRQGGGLPVIFAHSNGGGLSQMLLDRGLAKAAALAIVAGTPNFGGWGVYKNWAKFDPWFLPRMYFRDFFHPRSPLSKTSLVHRAFFCDEFPRAEVAKFEELMSPYLSYWWPIAIMGKYVETKKVLSALKGWGGGRVLVLAGEKDRLMSVNLMGRTAEEYRAGRISMVRSKELSDEGTNQEVEWGSGDRQIDVLGGFEGIRAGVGYRIVEGAGHHIHNDIQKYTAASYLEEWLRQLNRVPTGVST